MIERVKLWNDKNHRINEILEYLLSSNSEI